MCEYEYGVSERFDPSYSTVLSRMMLVWVALSLIWAQEAIGINCSDWYADNSSGSAYVYKVFEETRSFRDAAAFCSAVAPSGNLMLLRDESMIKWATREHPRVWLGYQRHTYEIDAFAFGFGECVTTGQAKLSHLKTLGENRSGVRGINIYTIGLDLSIQWAQWDSYIDEVNFGGGEPAVIAALDPNVLKTKVVLVALLHDSGERYMSSSVWSLLRDQGSTATGAIQFRTPYLFIKNLVTNEILIDFTGQPDVCDEIYWKGIIDIGWIGHTYNLLDPTFSEVVQLASESYFMTASNEGNLKAVSMQSNFPTACEMQIEECDSGTCPVGSVERLELQTCELCPSGRVVNPSNLTECARCPLGESPFFGSCSPCPKGTYSTGLFCQLCRPGRFNPFESQTSCFDCDSGKFQSETGNSACIDCLDGKFSSNGWSNCLPTPEIAYEIGCADGEREWFTNRTTHPLIAGCSGSFSRFGVKKDTSLVNHETTCTNFGGDDGPFPNGGDCSASDLCAEGWHLCSDSVEVRALSGTGDCDVESNSELDEELFFATGQSTDGSRRCIADGVNDIFGCGKDAGFDDPHINFGSGASAIHLWLSADNYSAQSHGYSWKDRSPNGFDFTLSSLNVRQTDSESGSSFMDFSGAFGGAYSESGISIPESGVMTIFVVTNIRSSNYNNRTLLSNPNSVQIIINEGSNSLGTWYSGHQSSGFAISPEMTRSWNIMEFELSNTVPYFTFALNGENKTWEIDDSAVRLRHKIHGIGMNTYNMDTQFWGGIKEIIIFGRKLNITERGTALRYLNRKWSLNGEKRLLQCSECSCGPLNKLLSSSSDAWQSSLSDYEALAIQKLSPKNGGVLCCRNVSCSSCALQNNQVCRPKISGCSDGSREWFKDPSTYPNIAGCAGAFSVPGLIQHDGTPIEPMCDRQAGNSAMSKDGLGCSAVDLCEPGWKICDSTSEILSSSSGRFCDTSRHLQLPSGSFFASAASFSVLTKHCLTNLPTENSIPGCGNLNNGNLCGLFQHFAFNSHISCDNLPLGWNCSLVGSFSSPLFNISKSFTDTGGVLCCREKLAICESCPKSSEADCALSDWNSPWIRSIYPQNSSSEGGGMLTIFGNNFGTSGQVFIGDRACSFDSENYTDSQIVCTIPSLPGGYLPVYVENDREIRSQRGFVLSVDPPIINSLQTTGNRFPTIGGIILTIYGRNFGDRSASITVGGNPCPENTSAHTHSSIECILPSGQGTLNPVFVTVDQKLSSAQILGYDPPHIERIFNQNGRTNGGDTITLVGMNFGTEGKVQVNEEPCDVSEWSHLLILCKLPEGAGANLKVVVISDGQNSTSNSTRYSYAVPSINYLSQLTLSSASPNSSILIIQGHNFGPSPRVFFGEVEIPINGRINHTFLDIKFPHSLSGTETLRVMAANQNSSCFAPSCILSIEAPELISVSGCASSESIHKTELCPITGSISIAIMGYNFGTNPSVRVQGFYCLVLDHKIVPETGIHNTSCLLPANPRGQLDALVEIEVGGKIGSSRLLSYASPYYSTGTLRMCSSGDSIHLLNSSGGEAICFDLENLPLNLVSAEISIRYGLFDSFEVDLAESWSSIWLFNCSNATLAVNSNTVSCFTSNGFGKNLSLLIRIKEQFVSTSMDGVSYKIPILVSGSIRGTNGTMLSAYSSTKGLSDMVLFDVDNLDIAHSSAFWNQISVRYGRNDSISLEYVCDIQAIIPSSTPGRSTIRCLTQAGIGVNLVFQLTALNTASELSSFTFSYPQIPVINSVRVGSSSSCINDGDSIRDCSTLGGERILVSGQFFCDFSSGACSVFVFIGVVECTLPEFIDSSSLACTLLEGSGINLPISIHQMAVGSTTNISIPRNLVSYAYPSIYSVSGCVDIGSMTKDCSRTSSSLITIRGVNFGPRSAQVFVNFKYKCSNLSHHQDYPHNILTCTVGADSLLEATVTVIQDGGSLGFEGSSGYISYKQCDPGTKRIEDSLDCPSCEAGKYNPVTGSSACFSCEPGKYSDVNASTYCELCAEGSYSLEGATTCLLCAKGNFTSNRGSAICSICESGRFTADEGLTSCNLCPKGQYSSSPGQSSCKSCAPGTFSFADGSESCVPCGPGFYTNISASTSCAACPAGFRSKNSAGSSECVACQISTFSPSTGLSFCKECREGRVSTHLASTECILCQPGRYDSLSGLSYCKNCPAGKFTAESGTIDKCLPCLPGSFAPSDGLSSCNTCPPGKFQQSQGEKSCDDCPPGRVNIVPGQSKCVTCDPGYFSNVSGSTSCSPCPAGTALNLQNPLEGCQVCPKGKFSASQASFDCDECPLGKYSSIAGMTTCDYCSRGKYQKFSGSSHCEVCSPGFFASSIGNSLCTPCDLGKYSPRSSSWKCDSCFPGEYQPFSGASTCLSCPQGKAISDFASVSCTACGVGRFANISGLSSCLSCSEGKYQPLGEQQICLVCPVGKFSSKEAASCSDCSPRSVAPFPEMKSCVPCPDNSDTNSERSLCVCEAGYYAIEKTVTVNNESVLLAECIECPLGAVCENAGVRWETLETRPGWWRADRNSTTFYQCQLVDHCVGGLTGQCGGNRDGVLCNKCREGYEVVGAVCRKCGSASTSIVVFSLMVCLVFVIIVFMFYVVLKMDKHQLHQLKYRSELEKASADLSEEIVVYGTRRLSLQNFSTDGTPTPAPNFVYKLKIILGFFQICVAMAFSLDIPWPDLFKSFISTFNVANFDIVQWTRFGCVLPITYLEKHLIVAVFPLALIGGTYFFYLFPKTIVFYKRRFYSVDQIKNEEILSSFKRGKRKFFKMVLFSIFLIYPTVSSVILKLFSCRYIEGTSFLTADFRVRCDSEEWKRQAKLNILFTIMFPVAIPLCFTLLLFTHRHRLHYPETLVKLGFLYAAYYENSWWFEILDVLYKLALTSLLIFVPIDLRIPVAISITLTYLVVFLVFRPYIRKGDDRLHGFVLVEILVMLIGGYVYREIGKIDPFMDVVLGILFIGITIGLILLLVFQIVISIRKKLHFRKHKTTTEESRLEVKAKEIRSDPRLYGVNFSRNPLFLSTKNLGESVKKDEIFSRFSGKEDASSMNSIDSSHESTDSTGLHKENGLGNVSKLAFRPTPRPAN